MLCVIGNVGTLRGNLTLIPGARPDDGLLDIYIASPRRFRHWVKIALRLMTRRAKKDDQVDQHRGKRCGSGSTKKTTTSSTATWSARPPPSTPRSNRVRWPSACQPSTPEVRDATSLGTHRSDRREPLDSLGPLPPGQKRLARSIAETLDRLARRQRPGSADPARSDRPRNRLRRPAPYAPAALANCVTASSPPM